MPKRSRAPKLRQTLAAFILERHPFALDRVLSAIGDDADFVPTSAAASVRRLGKLRRKAARAIEAEFAAPATADATDPTPGVDATTRMSQAREEILETVDGFFQREEIRLSLSDDERREMLRGMILTRAVDNQLKSMFLSGDVRFEGVGFQGKGFRSLGQEAIYAAALRLRRGDSWLDEDGIWRGDIVAPLIRDLGVALAMRPDAATVRMVLNAQAGKAGAPMDGRDFHIGDPSCGILPASAPLSISTATCAGLAMAFALREEPRVALSFIGEGGSSLGEWHEAINACAARRLPAIFCVQNNQTALSTPLSEQTSVRVFADKAVGYGIPGISVDGTDPEAIACAFAWAAERAREGKGPSLIEVVAMRMCGHAHHDDMLYLGKEPRAGWDYPQPDEQGYVDPERWKFWAAKDPIRSYAQKLEEAGLIAATELAEFKATAEALVEEQMQQVIDAPWPEPAEAGARVFAGDSPRVQEDPLIERGGRQQRIAPLPAVEVAPPFDPKGKTLLEAVMLGVGDALDADPRTFVYGEDVGGNYGNAFLLLRPLLQRYGSRILNSPLCEGGILGVCVGAALAGMRPIGEIQFNDFVATGFNQLVNNAAKIRYRWGGSVPMVVRMPWGGLRKAGPYHSQNTEPWFYRTPGLKIVTPSTPYDARALMAAAVADPDPVLYYEHIALYRDPRIRQALDDDAPPPLPLGRAALRRSGADIALISYGAQVHACLRVAERLAADGIDAAVLDLRSLVPLDRDALLALARHTGKVLIAHEDSRRGGIGESLAAIVQEELFEELDAPIRIVGSLDAPVPYSPPLERAFVINDATIESAARNLAAY